MKIIPVSADRRSRYISPCCRVASSAAISTRTAVPSGKTTRGPAWAVGAGAAGGGGAFTPQPSRRRSPAANNSLLILHLEHFLLLLFRLAGNQVVLLGI